MAEDIRNAHEKIRELDSRQDEQERRMVRTEAAAEHAAAAIEQVRTEMNQQFDRLFDLIMNGSRRKS